MMFCSILKWLALNLLIPADAIVTFGTYTTIGLVIDELNTSGVIVV